MGFREGTAGPVTLPRGRRVIGADLDADGITAAVREHGLVAGRVVDVTDPIAVETLVSQIIAEEGRIDLVINSVGVAIAGELRDAGVEDLRGAVEVNLMGTIFTTLSAYRHMVPQGSGTIVNISSGSGLFPLPARTHYTTTKFGVVGFSTALRQEARRLGIHVCVACPGVVKTAIFGRVRLVGPIDRGAVAARLASNRGLSPDLAAQRILRGVAAKRAIITIDRQVRLLWFLWRFLPGIFERLTDRMAGVLDSYRLT